MVSESSVLLTSNYFSNFVVTKVLVKYCFNDLVVYQHLKRSSVTKVIEKFESHEIGGKWVECKPAVPQSEKGGNCISLNCNYQTKLFLFGS